MFIIFGNRGCSWLPGNRVKNMIAEKEIFIGDSLNEIMKCAGITNDDIYSLLNESGDVDFSASKTDQNPKIYLLEGEKNDAVLGVRFALYDSTAEVVDLIYKTASGCTSQLSNSTKTVVPLPNAEVRAIIESKERRILDKAQCQMNCLGIAETDILNFHTTANFNVSLSQPRKFPNPVYAMDGKIGTTTYTVIYVIGENRSRIADILPNNCDCTE